MKFYRALFRPLALTLLFGAPALAAPAFYDTAPLHDEHLLCLNGECAPSISKTTYFDRPAYKLTNGAVEAIVVPEIGRVMRWGKVGGPNLMWNSAQTRIQSAGWKNYGGDKTWLSPQSSWINFHGQANWPPDAAFDGQPQKAEVLSGGKLQLTTPLSPTGIRIVRTLYFDDNGEFVIEQTAHKESGAPLQAGLWSISQSAPGQAVFFAVDPKTRFKDGFHRFESDNKIAAAWVRPDLIRVVPRAEAGGKLGFETQIAALAVVDNGVAWVQKAARPDGDYPDGAPGGGGFPLETYVNGDAKNYYQEVEILGPLHQFAPGTSLTQTVRWTLHNLPSSDANAPAVVDAIEKLLH